MEKDGNYIKEDGIANLEAKWETAHKQDLGIEMGWLQNTLTLNVDFFDETREDIFLPPIVTMFVGGVGYKEVNMGAVKNTVWKSNSITATQRATDSITTPELCLASMKTELLGSMMHHTFQLIKNSQYTIWRSSHR